jgi:hypothetical protein
MYATIKKRADLSALEKLCHPHDNLKSNIQGVTERCGQASGTTSTFRNKEFKEWSVGHDRRD